jgi:uncharacterized lipoprotein YajG
MSTKWIATLAGALLAAALAGCVAQPQNIRIDAPVAVSPADVGQGKVVWLRVSDARRQKTLGVIGDLTGQYAHVSVEDDPSGALYQNIADGLRKLGFQVQPTPGPDDRMLSVEVRDIQYEALKKTLTVDTRVKVAIVAKAEHGSDRYDRQYEAGQNGASPVLPAAEDNARAVNETVSMVLADMLGDRELVTLLAN